MYHTSFCHHHPLLCRLLVFSLIISFPLKPVFITHFKLFQFYKKEFRKGCDLKSIGFTLVLNQGIQEPGYRNVEQRPGFQKPYKRVGLACMSPQ